jgi:hypothetical protein
MPRCGETVAWRRGHARLGAPVARSSPHRAQLLAGRPLSGRIACPLLRPPPPLASLVALAPALVRRRRRQFQTSARPRSTSQPRRRSFSEPTGCTTVFEPTKAGVIFRRLAHFADGAVVVSRSASSSLGGARGSSPTSRCGADSGRPAVVLALGASGRSSALVVSLAGRRPLAEGPLPFVTSCAAPTGLSPEPPPRAPPGALPAKSRTPRARLRSSRGRVRLHLERSARGTGSSGSARRRRRWWLRAGGPLAAAQQMRGSAGGGST